MENPFANNEDFENTVVEYETIRREGKVNMWSLGMFWDRAELLYVMDAYKNGTAQEIIGRKMDEENKVCSECDGRGMVMVGLGPDSEEAVPCPVCHPKRDDYEAEQ